MEGPPEPIFTIARVAERSPPWFRTKPRTNEEDRLLFWQNTLVCLHNLPDTDQRLYCRDHQKFNCDGLTNHDTPCVQSHDWTFNIHSDQYGLEICALHADDTRCARCHPSRTLAMSKYNKLRSDGT